MGKAQTFDFEDYTGNLRSVFAKVTREDYAEGTDWYPYAGSIARSIAAETGHEADAVAAIISALSPRIWWDDNVAAAQAVCRAAAAGQSQPKTRAFDRNTARAFRIAKGEDWRDVLKGIKVESFVANITGDLARVTVDTWALRAATLGERDTVRNENEYRAVELAYQTVAAEVGLMPAELQAVIWVAVKRMCKDLRGGNNSQAARANRLAA